MKKTLMIALAGMMLFAFTQCGGGGSKEFQVRKKATKELIDLANSAKTCEDLMSEELEKKAEKIESEMEKSLKDLKEEDKMTKEEQAELEKLEKELTEIAGKLCK